MELRQEPNLYFVPDPADLKEEVDEENCEQLILTRAEEDDIYSAKTSRTSNICLQMLLVLFLLIYIYLETVSFRSVFQISNNIKTIFQFETPRANMTIDDIRAREDIFEWINVTIQRTFSSVPYEKTYPSYLTEYPDELFEIPVISSDMQARWIRQINRNNYVTGIRINVLHQMTESTEDTIYQEVIKTARKRTNYANINIEKDTLLTSNTSELGPTFKYRPKGSSGYFGEGFVHYISGNTSVFDAMAQLQSLRDSNWFSEPLSLCSFEIMFYNLHLSYGIIYNYDFYVSYSGIVSVMPNRRFFMTEQYNLDLTTARTKLSIAVVWQILLVVIGLQYFYNSAINVHSLVKLRRNDFRVMDLVHGAQFFVGLVVTANYYHLYFSSRHHLQFRIPFSSEDDFQLWVDQSITLYAQRVLLSCQCIIQIIILVDLGQAKIPSLGIIFESVMVSGWSLFLFSSVVAIILTTFSFGSYLAFGVNMYGYTRFDLSLLWNYKMILGDLDYESMNKANPVLSAPYFYVFVFLFCYLFLNIFKAILIQTYNQLRNRRLLVSTALVQITLNEFKSQAVLIYNLIFFRQPQAGMRNVGSQQNFCQLLIYNLKQLRQEPLAKAEFVAELQAQCKAIKRANREYINQQKEFYSSQTDQNVKLRYHLLKNLAVYLGFTVVQQLLFSRLHQSRYQKAFQDQIRNIFQNFQPSEESLSYFQTGDSVYRVSNYETLKGYSEFYYPSVINHFLNESHLSVIPDKDRSFRATIRLYQQALNFDTRTAEIFPTILPPSLDVNGDDSQEWLSIISYWFQSPMVPQKTEYDADFFFKCDSKPQKYKYTYECFDDVPINYTSPQDKYKSALDDGGYVFNFDKKALESHEVGMSIGKVLSLPWNLERAVAKVVLENALYQVNFDIFTVVRSVFKFEATGALQAELVCESIIRNQFRRWDWILLFVLYCLFSIYSSVKTTRDIYKFYLAKKPHQESSQEVTGLPLTQRFVQYYTNNIRMDQSLLMLVVQVIILTARRVYFFVRTLVVYMYRYLCVSPYHMMEVSLIVLQFMFIVYSFISMCQPKIEPDSEGQVSGLIEILSVQVDYQSSLKQISSFLTILQLLYLFRYLKFSLLAYLPINALYRSRVDLVNIVCILWLLLIASCSTAFLLFGIDTWEYSSITSAGIHVFSYVMGDYRLTSTMEHSPLAASVFFIFTSTIILLVSTIFLAIIEGHMKKELKLCRKISEPDDYYFNRVVWRILVNYWRVKKREKKVKRDNMCTKWCRKLCKPLTDRLDRLDRTEAVAASPSLLDSNNESDSHAQKLGLGKTNVIVQKMHERLSMSEDNSTFAFDNQEQLLNEMSSQQSAHIKAYVDIYEERSRIQQERGSQRQTQSSAVQNLKQGARALSLSESDDHNQMTQSSFWLQHLEENIETTFKKRVQLYDFKKAGGKYTAKSFETVFGRKHVFDGISIIKISDFTERTAQNNIIRFFTQSKQDTGEHKRLWECIDRVHLNENLSCLRQRGRRPDKFVDVIKYLLFSDAPQTGQEVLLKLSYDQFYRSGFLTAEMQMVPDFLQTVWINHLNHEQKFKLWQSMNTRHRVRLWNSLTFQFKYFKAAALTTSTVDQRVIHRYDLREMCDRIDQRLSTEKKAVYSASIMRDLWRQLSDFAHNQNDREAPIHSRAWREQFGEFVLPPAAHSAQPRLGEQEALLLKMDQVTQFFTQLQVFQNEFKHIISDTSKDKLQQFIAIHNFSGRYNLEGANSDSLTPQQQPQAPEIDERLSLWLIMSREERFDLFMHQLLPSEAQILARLIDLENTQLQLGIKSGQQRQNRASKQSHSDQEFNLKQHLQLVIKPIENSLNMQVFTKFINFLRYQATHKAERMSEQRLEAKAQQDKQLIDYAYFLKERFAVLDKIKKESNNLRQDKISRNNLIKKQLLKIAWEHQKREVHFQDPTQREESSEDRIQQMQLKRQDRTAGIEILSRANSQQDPKIRQALKYAEYVCTQKHVQVVLDVQERRSFMMESQVSSVGGEESEISSALGEKDD